MIDIILTDDHQLFRVALKEMLVEHAGFNVVAEANSASELRNTLKATACDVLILDISLPDSTGLQFLQSIHKHYPNLNVLMLSMHNESQYGIRAMKLGAKGYLSKDTNPEELFVAIKTLAQGKQYISKAFGNVLADHVIDESNSRAPHTLLSTQEFEVMRLLSRGIRINDIAIKLSLSTKTISTYRHRILKKLHLENTAEIIRYCVEHDIE
jgi:two-component system, NarL family, invasion response regulator UvrY